MIQALNKQYEVVRTVIESDVNDVLVCKSLTGDTRRLYTLIRVKDRALCSRMLEIISRGDGLSPWSGGFREMVASESSLIIVFDYNDENRLFYYKTLYWRNFADRLQAARNLLSELMSFNLPNELIFFMLEDENINLTADGRIYFNYFADLKFLSPSVSTEDVVCKAASLAFRILSDGLRTQPKELTLLKRKISRRAFSSFTSVYTTLRDMPDRLEADVTMLDLAKRGILSRKERIAGLVKTALLVLILAASLFYSVTQIRSRAVPATTDNITEEYQGLNKIGTVILGKSSGILESSDTVTKQQGE